MAILTSIRWKMWTVQLPIDRSQVFAIEWRHCECCCIITLLYIFKVTRWNANIWNTARRQKMLKFNLVRDRYLPSNGTIAIGELRDLDLHSQDQTFSYAFPIKKYACSRCDRQICLRRGVALALLLSSGSKAKFISIQRESSNHSMRKSWEPGDIIIYRKSIVYRRCRWRHIFAVATDNASLKRGRDMRQ